MQANGWTLLFHACLIGQLRKLSDATSAARARDPEKYRSNANVRVLAALSKLILKTVPEDPGQSQYRQGNTLGPDYRHWRRVKFGGRFRLFFRYHKTASVIVFAWVNDERTLRARGGRNDPYTVFRKMLDRNDPPDDWETLRLNADDPPGELAKALRDAEPGQV